MQRRIEQPDRHGQPCHRLEDALEVALLERQQPVERRAPAGLAVGEDHLLHDRQAIAEEHVLGPAEADSLRTELAGARCVFRVVGVRAHLEPALGVGPAEDRLEVLVDLRRHEWDFADEHATRPAVDRDHVALDEPVVADRRDAVAERQLLAAGDTRLTHASGDDRGVRRHAAVHRQDSLRRDHPVNVVRGRLPADENHRAGLRALDSRVGVEDDPAARSARGRVEPLRSDVELGARVDHRVQQLVELRRVDPHDRLFARDQALARHRHRGLQRGGSRALRRARLQEEQLLVLDRELDVLHVAVVLFETTHRLEQLVERLRQRGAHRLDRLRRADAGDDILALGVGEELAIETLTRRSTGHE